MTADTRPPRDAWVVLVLLVGLFVVVVALLTPWDVLGTDAPRPPAEDYFTAREIARSEAFHDAIRWPSWLGLITGLIVIGLLGFSRVGRRLVTWTRTRVQRWWLQVLVLVVAVSLVQRLVTLPFAIWARTITRDYGLSTNTWAAWSVDVLKAFGVSVLLTSLGLLALVGLARRLPRRWYLPAAGGAAALVLGLSFLYPVVFEPLFNKFEPMPDGFLRDRLVALADQDGIHVSEVLVADASRRTTTLNAYVSGFGSTKRIVVYDNLLAQAPADQIELIVAHELSHAKYDDVLVGTVEGAIGAAIAMVALSLALGSRRLRRPVDARSAGDPAVVPVILALAAFATLATAPVHNGISRQFEARADEHSLELTNQPETFIKMQQRLGVTNLAHLDPNPVLSFWFASHPTTLDRIGMALDFESRQDGSEDGR